MRDSIPGSRPDAASGSDSESAAAALGAAVGFAELARRCELAFRAFGFVRSLHKSKGCSLNLGSPSLKPQKGTYPCQQRGGMEALTKLSALVKTPQKTQKTSSKPSELRTNTTPFLHFLKHRRKA